jgi:hypothetical protein
LADGRCSVVGAECRVRTAELPTQLERRECAGDQPISDGPSTGGIDPDLTLKALHSGREKSLGAAVHRHPASGPNTAFVPSLFVGARQAGTSTALGTSAPVPACASRSIASALVLEWLQPTVARELLSKHNVHLCAQPRSRATIWVFAGQLAEMEAVPTPALTCSARLCGRAPPVDLANGVSLP